MFVLISVVYAQCSFPNEIICDTDEDTLKIGEEYKQGKCSSNEMLACANIWQNKKCPYPDTVDCDTKEEAEIITKLWEKGICAKQDSLTCITIWTNSESKCSYPSKYDCDTNEEVLIIQSEWVDGICTRDELGQCIERWSSSESKPKCTAEWKCDGNYKYYVNSDCSTSNRQYCEYGCSDGKCKSKTCLSGWKCDGNYRYYLNSDCTQSSRSYCQYGCSNGVCKSCTPSWSCGSWSSCINGRQTRSCTDRNNCGTNSGKPPTSRSCTLVSQSAVSQKYDNPVVLVHGWHGDSSTFYEMKNKLSNEGFLTYSPDLYTFSTQQYFGEEFTYMVHDSIKKHAERLKSYINSISRGNKVDIVAHSMGGLIARYYIKYLGGDRYVDKLILSDTPNHGADLAKLAPGLSGWSPSIPSSEFNDPSATEMTPNSQFLKDLNTPEEAYGNIKYYTIRDKGDLIVTLSSAKLEGAKGDKVVNCGHLRTNKPSKCPEAYNYILEVLGKKTTSSPPTGDVVKEQPQQYDQPKKDNTLIGIIIGLAALFWWL